MDDKNLNLRCFSRQVSNEQPEIFHGKVEKLQKALRKLGYTIGHSFMSLSLLSLPVLPELRITDKGVVDVKKFKFISLFA